MTTVTGDYNLQPALTTGGPLFPTEQQWEHVGSGVYRFVVPGGWLYSYSYSRRYMVFVPEPK